MSDYKHKLAVIAEMNSVGYFESLMAALGSEWVTFYCQPNFLQRCPDIEQKCSELNIEIVVGDLGKALRHNTFLVDLRARTNNTAFFAELGVKKANILIYVHTTGKLFRHAALHIKTIVKYNNPITEDMRCSGAVKSRQNVSICQPCNILL